MTRLKAGIENKFEDLGRVLYRHPIKTLLVLFLIIGTIASQIPHLIVDTSTEGMLHKNDRNLMEYNAYRDQFGNSTIILIGIKSANIFTPDVLEILSSLHQDLENEVPYLDEVTSLINVRHTRGEGDTLYADGFLENWKTGDIGLDRLKEIAKGHLLYQNSLISEDGSMTAIIIETDASVTETAGGMSSQDDILSGFEDDISDDTSDDMSIDAKQSPVKRYFSEKDNATVIAAIEQVLERYRNKGVQLALTGRPVVIHNLNVELKKDMSFLTRISAAMIVCFLFLLFRRVSGILLPLIPIFSSIPSTFGVMAFFGVPITLFTAILPSFIIAVGVADAIHILAIFYRQYHMGASKEDAIAYSLGHSGLAIVLTSLTTAAGLLSFSFSELAALGGLGIFAAVGVMFALFYSICMFPAIIALVPLKRIKTNAMDKHMAFIDRILLFFSDFSLKHPGKIIMVSMLIVIVSIFGALKIRFSHNLLKSFPDYLPVKQDSLLVDEDLKGSLVLRVVIDTAVENGLYEPAMLNNIERFTRRMENIRIKDLFVGKVASINNILKETNQALNGNDPAYYVIPEDRDLIAQELLLFENTGSDDLEQIVDSQFSKTSMTVKIPYVDYAVIDEFIETLESEFDTIFRGSAGISITGIPAIMGRTIPMAQNSMWMSYIIAFVVISIMMVFFMGSIKLGLLCMIPNTLPILAVMGLMGYAGVGVDMQGLMIGSIALGLVVDDTMHFMYNFSKFYEISGSVRIAIKETMLGTGRALLITSLVLCAFFFSMTLGTLKGTIVFGMYTSLVIVVALIADFILLPAVLSVFFKQKHKGA